jgi:MbtH protein
MIDDEQQQFRVVVNHEEQYSTWFADRELPAGWTAAGTTGTKSECLAHIDGICWRLRM